MSSVEQKFSCFFRQYEIYSTEYFFLIVPTGVSFQEKFEISFPGKNAQTDVSVCKCMLYVHKAFQSRFKIVVLRRMHLRLLAFVFKGVSDIQNEKLLFCVSKFFTKENSC